LIPLKTAQVSNTVCNSLNIGAMFANPVRKSISLERLESIDSENMSSFEIMWIRFPFSPIWYMLIGGGEDLHNHGNKKNLPRLPNNATY
jgi:hypothetical protein